MMIFHSILYPIAFLRTGSKIIDRYLVEIWPRNDLFCSVNPDMPWIKLKWWYGIIDLTFLRFDPNHSTVVYFANITFGSIVVSWRQDRNLKHRCSTWSYQNIPPRSVSCIEQKQSDNEFSLDDLSEMSLSLGGLAVSRSGNCREPICTKCHVVTKMKYKFSKYRIVQNHF